MTCLVDLGTASSETRQIYPNTVHTDGPKLVQNGIKYRSSNLPPEGPKIADPN